MEPADYLQSLFGMVAMIAVAIPLSANPRAINWRLVGVAMLVQFALALLLLRVPLFQRAFVGLTSLAETLQGATEVGTSFVFGYLGGGDAPFDVTHPENFSVFAFQVLPLVIIMSALSALFWHWRVLPLLATGISRLLQRSLGIGGPVGLGAAANILVGQVEGLLLVRPYLRSLTRHELLVLMTCGMATIAGTVMVIYTTMLEGLFPEGVLGHLLTASVLSVPAAIMYAHIIIPSRERSEFPEQYDSRLYHSTMDAITRGSRDGLDIWLNIIAILLVLVTLVALVNSILGLLVIPGGEPLSLERLCGWLFAPLAWCMGVPWEQAITAGSLLGVKTVLNEFIAYLNLAGLEPGALSERSHLIMLYGLCGFANFASVGIQVGGLLIMAPERQADFLAVAIRAMLGATLASCMTGAMVGVL